MIHSIVVAAHVGRRPDYPTESPCQDNDRAVGAESIYTRISREMRLSWSAAARCPRLCQQACEALSLALACSADSALRDLSVVTVSPAPDASRLLVTIAASESVDHDHILDKLQVARGYLRSEVAAAIHRKRTPELMFRVLVGPTVSQ